MKKTKNFKTRDKNQVTKEIEDKMRYKNRPSGRYRKEVIPSSK